MKKTRIAGLIGMMTTLTGAFAPPREAAADRRPAAFRNRRVLRQEDRNLSREEGRRRAQVARGALSPIARGVAP